MKQFFHTLGRCILAPFGWGGPIGMIITFLFLLKLYFMYWLMQ